MKLFLIYNNQTKLNNVEIIKIGSKLIKIGEGNKKKKILLSKSSAHKKRIFYLFSDKLIYCDLSKGFKGLFSVPSIRISDENTTTFKLHVQLGKVNKCYFIACGNEMVKKDWLVAFHDCLQSKSIKSSLFFKVRHH